MIFGPKELRPYPIRLAIWLAKICVIVFLVIGTVKWVNSPAKGEIIKKEPETRESVIIENNTYGHYDGKLISFDYKPSYIEQKEENNLSDGDRVILFGGKGSSNRFTVVAGPIAVIDLNEVSAVQMRRAKTELYSEETIQIDNSPALLFKKKDEFERVALIIKDNKLLTVSMMAVSNDLELETEFLTLVNSVKWK